MRYYLGVDGGGTKTNFLLADETGARIWENTTSGASYVQYGVPAVVELVMRNLQQCQAETGMEPAQIAGMCLGLPCYGESVSGDQQLQEAFAQALGSIPYRLTNDVEVAWAGSLGLESGINIVAGTGSIAYGRDDQGNEARCGGWSEHFSDEGSGYWLGMKTMQLFTQQADGRVPKGALYTIICDHFSLNNDFEFIDLMAEVLKSRDQVASLQRLLLQAAQAGDESALKAYALAVEELTRIVLAVREQLMLTEPFRVSFSGGLFQILQWVRLPFCEAMMRHGAQLVEPMHSPVQGAVLLAKQLNG